MATAITGQKQGDQKGGYVWILSWSHFSDEASNSSSITVTYTMKKVATNSSSYNNYGTTVNITINGTTYTKSGITFDLRSADVGSMKVLFTKTVNIPHNPDGSKTVALSATHVTDTALGTQTVSSNVELTKIPRNKSTLVLSNTSAICGNSISMSITSDSPLFTHTIKAEFGGQTFSIATKTDAKTFSWIIPIGCINLMPNSTSDKGKILLETFNGNTSLGIDEREFTAIVPDNIVPTVSLDIKDVNEIVYGERFVGGISDIKCTVTGIPAYGSPIVEYRVGNVDSMILGNTITYSDISEGTYTIKGKVTDSRGRSAEVSRTITVDAYNGPEFEEENIIASLNENTNGGTSLYITNIKCKSEQPAILTITAKVDGTTKEIYKSGACTQLELNEKTFVVLNNKIVKEGTIELVWADNFNSDMRVVTMGQNAALGAVTELSKYKASASDIINVGITVNTNKAVKADIWYEFPEINQRGDIAKGILLEKGTVSNNEQFSTKNLVPYDKLNELFRNTDMWKGNKNTYTDGWLCTNTSNSPSDYVTAPVTGLKPNAVYSVKFLMGNNIFKITSLDGNIVFYNKKGSSHQVYITGVSAMRLWFYGSNHICYWGSHYNPDTRCHVRQQGWNTDIVTTDRSWTIPVTFGNMLKTKTSTTGYIYTKIYLDGTGTLIANNKSPLKLVVPDNEIPTINAFTIREGNPDLTSNGLNVTDYIAKKSKLLIDINASSTIVNSKDLKYETTIYGADTKTYKGSSFLTDTIDKPGIYTITTKVTDSRGRTNELSKQISILKTYGKPEIETFTVERCNSDGNPSDTGEYAKLNFKLINNYLIEGARNKTRLQIFARDVSIENSPVMTLLDVENIDTYTVTDKIINVGLYDDWTFNALVIDGFNEEVTGNASLESADYVPLYISKFEGYRSDEFGAHASTGRYAKLTINSTSTIPHTVKVIYRAMGEGIYNEKVIARDVLEFNEVVVIEGVNNMNYETTLVINDGVGEDRKSIVIKAGTDFNIESVLYNGRFKPTIADVPTDARTRVYQPEDIYNIPLPYAGQICYDASKDVHYVVNKLGSINNGGFELPNRKVVGFRKLDADNHYLNDIAFYSKIAFNNKIAQLKDTVDSLSAIADASYRIDFIQVLCNVENNMFNIVWHIPFLKPGQSPGSNYKIYFKPAIGSSDYVSYSIDTLIAEGKVIRYDDYFVYGSTFTSSINFFIGFGNYRSDVKTVEFNKK